MNEFHLTTLKEITDELSRIADSLTQFRLGEFRRNLDCMRAEIGHLRDLHEVLSEWRQSPETVAKE